MAQIGQSEWPNRDWPKSVSHPLPHFCQRRPPTDISAAATDPQLRWNTPDLFRTLLLERRGCQPWSRNLVVSAGPPMDNSFSAQWSAYRTHHVEKQSHCQMQLPTARHECRSPDHGPAYHRSGGFWPSFAPWRCGHHAPRTLSNNPPLWKTRPHEWRSFGQGETRQKEEGNIHKKI